MSYHDQYKIYPPSKEVYINPWVSKNLTAILWKFIFEKAEFEFYYGSKEGVPIIEDRDFRRIIRDFIIDSRIPKSLQHLEKIEKFQEMSKLPKSILDGFENVRKREDFFLSDSNFSPFSLKSDRILNAYFPVIHNPFGFYYLCCDYKVVKLYSEKEREILMKNHTLSEGFLKIGHYDTKNSNFKELNPLNYDSYPDFEVIYKFAMKKLETFYYLHIGDFFTYHCDRSEWSIYEFIELSNRMADELYFSKTESSLNIEYRVAFKKWLKVTIENKQLDVQKFSKSVKEKIPLPTVKLFQPILPKQLSKPKKTSTIERDLKIVARYLELIKSKPHSIVMTKLAQEVIDLGITRSQKRQIRKILTDNNIKY